MTIVSLRVRFKRFITSGFDTESDIYLLRKLVLINTLLLMIMILFGFFAAYNLGQAETLIAVMDAIGFIFSGIAFLQLHRYRKIEFAINLVIATLLLFFIAFAVTNQNESYGLIWTIFFPIFVLLLKGRRQGMWYVALFYGVLLPLAFQGIGAWQGGAWDLTSFIRFSAASLVVVYSAYFNEFAFARSYEELSKLRQRENRLAREHAAMIQTNLEQKNALLAEVAHEIRTPLTVLKVNLEALEDEAYNNREETFTLLHSRIADLSRLIADLHQLALADMGALQLEMQPLDPAQLIQQCITDFAPRATGRNIRLEFQDLRRCTSTMQADRQRIAQVVNNLISNSLRYTDAGGRLQIELTGGAGRVRMIFQDTAPGVPAADLPRLFDRLFRVEASRSRSTGGSGLGLAICKSIVEGHHGTIAATASELGGLRVVIELPEQH